MKDNKVLRKDYVMRAINEAVRKDWNLLPNSNGFSWAKADCPLCNVKNAGILFQHSKDKTKFMLICGSCRKSVVREKK